MDCFGFVIRSLPIVALLAGCGPTEDEVDSEGGTDGSSSSQSSETGQDSGSSATSQGSGSGGESTSSSSTGTSGTSDTDATSGTQTSNVTGTASESGESLLPCDTNMDAATCEAAQSPEGVQCTWLELLPTDPSTCAEGEPIGFCEDAIGEPGCGLTEGCDGEAFVVTLPDGSVAPFLTCGGPYPPLNLERCNSADDDPVCACACSSM